MTKTLPADVQLTHSAPGLLTSTDQLLKCRELKFNTVKLTTQYEIETVLHNKCNNKI